MRELPFFQIDAFAERACEGNQAGVMPLDAWLGDEVLQAIANENNVAETAFLIPDTQRVADYELRWFTPLVEVALCGHATLASGHYVLMNAPQMESVRFRTRRSGILTVGRDGGRLTLDLPAWPSHAVEKPGLAEALGAQVEHIYETTTASEPSLMVVLGEAGAVRALDPDFRKLAAFDGVLVIATAPGDGEFDVVSRVFAPAAGIDEDPVTGSAHAMLTPYWCERLHLDNFVARQASARGGTVGCRLAGDRVILSGNCVTVIEGIFRI